MPRVGQKGESRVAIVMCSDQYLSSDSRFRRWGKTILSPQDIDLTKKNGYSLTGSFVQWGDAVALQPGQFLVLAAETGSRNYHDYHYALIGVGADGQPVQVSSSEIWEQIEGSRLTDAAKAAARNSILYSYAAYCYLQMKSAVELTAEESALVEQLRALAPERRQAVLAALVRS